MSLVPGWHGTIFAPYFVAGAIFSGFAMVLTVLIPLRRIYGLESLITDYHFENMSRFLLFTSTILLYSYACEYFVAWYSAVEFEQTSFCLRLTGPYAAATFIMIFCNTILPQVLWVRRVRTHLPSLFVLSVLINIGMWFERYVIIVTGLSRKFAPSAWGIYLPSPIELGVLVSSFGFFCFMTLLFIKTLPMIAISEIKEIEIRRRQAKAAETTKDVRHRQATLTRRTLS
jgi:molybdopterin-containing oxidoreductase family membrane subunit